MVQNSDENRNSKAVKHFNKTLSELTETVGRLGDIHVDAIQKLAHDVFQSWKKGGKLMICGNGGSAADSQHIAAELVGRFLADRPGFAAMALTTNSSVLTAVGNDYGFDQIFSRQVQGLGTADDVLLVISTSGNSTNCILAVQEAREKGLKIHGFLGRDGGDLLSLVDSALVAPSDHTPRIQEIHITMGHLLCQILEDWVLTDQGQQRD
jgi:D-sedoheptulose 7-phosphate isomerase